MSRFRVLERSAFLTREAAAAATAVLKPFLAPAVQRNDHDECNERQEDVGAKMGIRVVKKNVLVDTHPECDQGQSARTKI